MSGQHFQGTVLNGIDAKNRVSIPSAYREVVRTRTGGQDLRLGKGRRPGCLIGYDSVRADQMLADHRARFGTEDSIEREIDAERLFGTVEDLTIDAAGRVVLSPILKAFGRIGAQALFVGHGDHFLLWNPEHYLAQPNLDPDLAAGIAAMIDAKAAA